MVGHSELRQPLGKKVAEVARTRDFRPRAEAALTLPVLLMT